MDLKQVDDIVSQSSKPDLISNPRSGDKTIRYTNKSNMFLKKLQLHEPLLPHHSWQVVQVVVRLIHILWVWYYLVEPWTEYLLLSATSTGTYPKLVHNSMNCKKEHTNKTQKLYITCKFNTKHINKIPNTKFESVPISDFSIRSRGLLPKRPR